MRGDPQHTWVFKTADGWARRVLASTSLDAGMILSEEILNARVCSYHAYRDHGGQYTDSKQLDAFHLTDFISCEIEHEGGH